jgi:hypothetical protein
MKQKLPGYQQAQKLIKLYQKAGFSNEEIADRLTTLEELIFTEIVVEIEEGMSKQKRAAFDRFLAKAPTPEKIAKFLNLDQKKMNQKIEKKIEDFTNQLEADLKKVKPKP